MLFSYRWLKELSGTKRSPEKLAELLITHAFEVETIEKYAHGLDDIVIGKVLSVEKHPQADRLRVTRVEVRPKEVHTIVCGAPNVAAGQKVAVILPGGALPDGTAIERTKIRGVMSHGMICSEKELRLGDAHAGILVLDRDTPLGKSFPSYAELDDTVLDVKILPDRSSDALSYQGLAREIAALEGVTAAYLGEKGKMPKVRQSSRVPKISVKTELCGRYLLALFDDVEVKESPLWLKVRLLVSGLRPVNAIVDVTNYLMLLTGQPMHAFDADAIGSGGIVVRLGRARERLALLDGQSIALSPQDVVIADTRKALALAGVMGGKHSAITEKTRRIAVEIAHFNASAVRKIRQRHHLSTDASYRFERGFDLERPGKALIELLRLMNELGFGSFAGIRDVSLVKAKPRTIRLPLSRVEQVLGTPVPLFEAVQHLALLGLLVKKVADKKELLVTIPTERTDLNDEWDLIEEIGRLRGYGAIKPVPPLIPLLPSPLSEAVRFERSLRRALVGLGYDETMLYSFYGEKTAQLFQLEVAAHLRLANPMNPDQALMRTTLVPNLLLALTKNLRHFETVRLFEIGSVHASARPSPIERKRVALALALPKKTSREHTFAEFHGHLIGLLENFGIKIDFEAMSNPPSLFHPTRMATLSTGMDVVGSMGELHPEIRKKLSLAVPVLIAEFEVDRIRDHAIREVVVETPPRYPFARRDISLIGPKWVTYREVVALFKEAGGPLLVSAELFDVYDTADERAYAFHLSFGAPDRTIRSAEMDAAFEAIVKRAEEKLRFRLRLTEAIEDGKGEY